MSDQGRIPTVSVGMPVHNGGRYLADAIDSVLQQTLQDFELVVLDNASTDSTRAIGESYASRDSRIRYVRNERNIGVNPNYCRVFGLSRGRYFKWASSNDLLDRTYLEKCVSALESDPDLVACFSGTALFSDRVEAALPYQDHVNVVNSDAVARFDAVLSTMGLNSAMNGVIRADVLRRTALIPDYASSDVLLIAELALHGKIRQLGEPLFFRRMTPESATRLKTRAELRRTHFVARRFGTYLPEIRQIGAYFSAAVRAPLSARDRLRLMNHLVRRTYWSIRHAGHRFLTCIGVRR
jgi:glycosyltransferase involved in cell wall biosynthesis